MAGEVDYIATLIIHAPGGDIRLECQSMEGGHPEAQGGFSRNAVSGSTRRRGGLPEMSNLTVEVEIDAYVWSQKERIKAAVDRARYTAIKQFVEGGYRTPVGDPDRFTGILGTPDFGSFDINGGDNTSMLEIESGVDGR